MISTEIDLVFSSIPPQDQADNDATPQEVIEKRLRHGWIKPPRVD